ncbi:hypothetical protein AC628_12125 [Bradyrhizobium sp. NAS96.2]|nr:hypothetical protein AC628_12125 [Bradyrhizobium sp. NAS96.2]
MSGRYAVNAATHFGDRQGRRTPWSTVAGYDGGAEGEVHQLYGLRNGITSPSAARIATRASSSASNRNANEGIRQALAVELPDDRLGYLHQSCGLSFIHARWL